MRRSFFVSFLYLLPSLPLAAEPKLELISVKRIWTGAPHNAFGDIIQFQNQWWCVFREGKWHVAKPGQEDDGKLRVITSKDGESWASAALIEEKGIDLRDPHLSVTPRNELMIVSGGSRYPAGKYAGRQPRVMFSSDGKTWSTPRAVLDEGMWLWRVTWFQGRAYGVAKYGSYSKELPENPRRANLVTSPDGREWSTVTELKVHGSDETTVRFKPDGTMVLLMRRRGLDDEHAAIGVSRPPYKDWKIQKLPIHVGGPNFIMLPTGLWVAGGRFHPQGLGGSARTSLGFMTADSYKPSLDLPSNGDSSYPGFAWHGNTLWTMYYSSHEGQASIYLAKVRVTN